MKLVNPNDPLLRGPDPQRELLNKFVEVSGGRPTELVIGAALNMLLNALRQTYPTRQQCEARYDDIVGRAKQLLLDHYDPVTGKRKNIFPFTQVVRAPMFGEKDKL